MGERIELHAVVYGRVQGVGFRATVRYHASQLGLSGTVSNLSNGAVEIFAQGKREELDKLLECVQRDLGLGYVERIDTKFSEPLKQYEGFLIIYK